MLIDIIGGGSIGLLCGAKLAIAGADVTVWTRSQEQADHLELQGIALQDANGEDEQIVKVKGAWIQRMSHLIPVPEITQLNQIRWIIIAVKQPDLNSKLLEQINGLAISCENQKVSILCLQNGRGHLEKIQKALPHITVLAAVTTDGARRMNGHTVRHTGKGQLWIGEWRGFQVNTDKDLEKTYNMLVLLLQTAGFTALLSNDMENRIFHKLLINAVINPLTAMFDVKNGELPLHPTRDSIMRALYVETEQILLEAGMTEIEDGWQQIIKVCQQTSNNISSMLSDVRAGRVTEIAAINGAVARLAEQLGRSAPLNQAAVVIIESLHPKLNSKE